MSRQNGGHPEVAPIYGFAIAWIVMSVILPMYRIWGILLALAVSGAASFFIARRAAKKSGYVRVKEAVPEETEQDKSKTGEQSGTVAGKQPHSPQVQAILDEGGRALSEMGRLYGSIKDREVRRKINEIMRITDKIAQDAVADPSDIPQIRKFMSYYLPTTIKLLNAYDRMSSQGIEGENLDKSMKNINEMLDAAIVAYKKRLDSLFANQALDIETDIEVMNTMLAREGLAGEKDFDIKAN